MMNFSNHDKIDDKFVCPSDRQLALRAKLHTGWSTSKNNGPLQPEEQAVILSVIRRNEDLESIERQRVGRLVERVEKLKERALDYGPGCCKLCGQNFGILGPSKLICTDCQKPVCSKCSIEIASGLNRTRYINLCRICSETREMWKKSGAWFFKGLPQYEIPERKTKNFNSIQQQYPNSVKLGMHIESNSESDDDNISFNSDCRNNYHRDSIKLHGGSSLLNFFDNDRKLSNSFGINFGRQLPTADNISNNSDWDTISTNSTAIQGTTITTSSSATTRTKIISNNIRRSSIISNWSIGGETNSTNLGFSFSRLVQQVCREQPLGWLEISLKYNEIEQILECNVLRARDLPPMDNLGLADPFCKLNIVKEDGKTKLTRWLQVKTVHKTRSPEFNEIITFCDVRPEELGNSVLYIVVLDDDKHGHDFLGAAKIGLSTIYSTTFCRMSIPLGSEDQHSMKALATSQWPRGHILISLSYNIKRRSLAVIIKQCSNLIPMDSNGSSDPFIKLQLKPDSHRKKYKTSIKWHTLNPIYNEEFYFETRPNDMSKQSLVITVWDKDIGKSNDFLGSLILGYNSKGRRLKQWTDCVKMPDHFHEQWHCLSNDLPTH